MGTPCYCFLCFLKKYLDKNKEGKDELMKTKLEKRVVFERSHTFLCAYKNLHNLPHWHGEHELVLERSGRGSITVNGTVFVLTEG